MKKCVSNALVFSWVFFGMVANCSNFAEKRFTFVSGNSANLRFFSSSFPKKTAAATYHSDDETKRIKGSRSRDSWLGWRPDGPGFESQTRTPQYLMPELVQDLSDREMTRFNFKGRRSDADSSMENVPSFWSSEEDCQLNNGFIQIESRSLKPQWSFYETVEEVLSFDDRK